ncbi:methionine ABC transporter ATP-binding protein [Nocardioides yefusunii]|uniref:Methionine ABC transporter ATP-binding protein n=1 Tax=Nocardioides yefusunii TaxID=2500546 RepID=A0ABW1QWC5_9ACTN|nr:methionine ABC transporter ATP-binding protein [Nocardioides yefusunii]
MAVVELSDVHKQYPAPTRKGEPVRAVNGVDLTVEAGEIHAIVGYSGAGKSTLVRLVNGLEPATSGSVKVNGTEITGLGEKGLRAVQSDIGMVFQQFNLFNSRTVWGNLEFPLKVAGVAPEERQRRISDLLHFVGLADKAHSYPDQLSGGQKQRVGIARALTTQPSLLLADECTSALDPDTTREVLALLRRVNVEMGLTVIVITHEMDVVKALAHRISVMEKGRVVEQGDVAEVFARPQADVTRRFVATLVDGVPAGDEIAELQARVGGRLISVDLAEGGAQSKVFALVGAHGVDVKVVQGGVNQVGASSFGHVVLSLDGEQADAAVAAVAALAGVEVLA